jgi:predicted  nucleic acid-binding Zn-ribbon protein
VFTHDFCKAGEEMPVNTEQELAFQGSPSEFTSLEEKIYRTIELLKHAREGKAAAERDLERVREQLELREQEVDQLKGEIVGLRKEREEVKSRVEKLVGQMDALIGQ